MHPSVYFSPVMIAFALTLGTPAKAAEPMPLQKESFKILQTIFQLQLPGQKTGSPSLNHLQFLREHTDSNQVTHVRMQQTYAGIPVLGGYAIFHSKQKKEVLLTGKEKVVMNGLVYKNLDKDLGKLPTHFLKNATLAIDSFKKQLQDGSVSQEKVVPVVYVDEAHQAHWAYKVSVWFEPLSNMPEKPTAIVDAESFKPFVQWNDLKTVRQSVKAMGAGGNEKVGEHTYGKDYPLLEITRDTKTNQCAMENKDVKVVDMAHRTSEIFTRTMVFRCKPVNKTEDGIFWTGYKADGYDKINGAYSPSNDALHSGHVIKHMYQEWYGLEVLRTEQGAPMRLVMRVHYGTRYENAFWDGQQMTFGDGAYDFYPLVSMGIASHEISHGFTEQYSDLIYYGQSGGINESFSDMAAQAAEYYSTGINDWKIGGDITKGDAAQAMRYMDMPSRDKQSIDRADEYYPGLDVHFSSGVFNRLFYLMATKPGWDTRKAFDVMVKANVDYWTPNASFEEAACGVLSAADDLKYCMGDVQSSLDAVAVKHTHCKRAVV